MSKLVPDGPWPERLKFETAMPRLKDGGLEKIRQWIKGANNPRFLIIDTLARVKSSKTFDQTPYEADYDSIIELKKLADEYGIAIVLVHHQRKMTAEDPIDTVTGSTGLTGAVDTVLVLHKTSHGPTLYGRGRDIEEIETALEFDPDTCKWRALGNAKEVHRTDERTAMCDLLRDAEDPLSPAQIADLLDMPRNNAKQLLYKMAKAAEVKRVGRGRYVHGDDDADNSDDCDNSDNHGNPDSHGKHGIGDDRPPE